MQYLTLPLFHYFIFRMFSVLRANDASALPSSTPTSKDAIAPASKSNIVPLTVGLTLGLLLPALAVLIIFRIRRQRSRKPPPSGKGDQQLVKPQESKHSPQPTQMPTHGSTLLSSAPTALAIPTAPIGVPGSEVDLSKGGSSRSGGLQIGSSDTSGDHRNI